MAALALALLVAVSVLLALPVLVLAIEVVAALTMRRARRVSADEPYGRVVVLVPAHNENNGLTPTIADISAQLRPQDRLVVIADNCTDDTARVARVGGGIVYERNDPVRRGKGYALDFGVRQLETDPPEIVIVIDADCRVANGSIAELARTCQATCRPVQALDLMLAPEDGTVVHRISEFTWRVKNWVRPLGLHALRLPCQLAGTGMAFPWEVIRSARLATGEVVEDLKLGLELAAAGSPPVFCLPAIVTSRFPVASETALTQRERWEGGHVRLIGSVALSALATSIRNRDIRLFALVLDVAVPPLMLLAGTNLVWLFLSAVLILFAASPIPFAITSSTFAAFVAVVFICWLVWGRDLLPLSSLGHVGKFALMKVALYRRIVRTSGSPEWRRTDRTSGE